MMETARRRAFALRRQHAISGIASDAAIDAVLAEAGVRVVPFPFAPGVREVVVRDAIGIAAWLPPSWRRWLVAHGLAHHLLHSGHQLRLARTCHPILARQEHEAEAFAGWLLWGDLPIERAMLPAELAELAGVPPQCVVAWWEIVSDLASLMASRR
jgi:Zn-dependent peptidase ImmA (M78 family)